LCPAARDEGKQQRDGFYQCNPTHTRVPAMPHHEAAAASTGYDFEEDFKEVQEFLKKEGFEQYEANFRKANVGPGEIPLLEDAHLKELGIVKVAHRIRMIQVTKGFRRALKNFERSQAILDLTSWYWRPMCYPRTFKITMAAIVVNDPQPFSCGYTQEQIDISSITDINMVEWANFLGSVGALGRPRLTRCSCCAAAVSYIYIVSKDPKLPLLRIRLGLHQAIDTFHVLKNLWEEDQLRIGKRVQ
jgi:hypothetical protein